MKLKYPRFISTLITFLKFWVQGRLKIYSSQDIKDSLSSTYLKRLPELTNTDICLYINNTYLIFHEDGGMSVCNKYNIISSESLIFDHRDGYCESIEFIQPWTECDKDLQPKDIVDKYFSLK